MKHLRNTFPDLIFYRLSRRVARFRGTLEKDSELLVDEHRFDDAAFRLSKLRRPPSLDHGRFVKRIRRPDFIFEFGRLDSVHLAKLYDFAALARGRKRGLGNQLSIHHQSRSFLLPGFFGYGDRRIFGCGHDDSSAHRRWHHRQQWICG